MEDAASTILIKLSKIFGANVSPRSSIVLNMRGVGGLASSSIRGGIGFNFRVTGFFKHCDSHFRLIVSEIINFSN